METRVQIKLCDVTNANEFTFVKETSDYYKKTLLKNYSSKVKENLERLLLSTADHSLEVGNLFYVLYNHEWTRAKIIKKDDCQIAFYLIDLGKTHIIEFENVYHQVAVLPEDKLCAEMPPSAQRFQLFGKFCIHVM